MIKPRSKLNSDEVLYDLHYILHKWVISLQKMKFFYRYDVAFIPM